MKAKIPEVVVDAVAETSDEDYPENRMPGSPTSETVTEEYQAADQSLKKSAAYRLPFFAKLHSWKKK